MITAEELRILVRAETKQARTEMDRFRKTSQDTKLDVRQLTQSLIGPLGATAAVIGLTKAAKDFIVGGIRYASEIEQMATSFDVLLGSGEAAADMMRDLERFASSTPLELQSLASGATKLIGFGTAADDVVETMRRLGNAAQGKKEILDRLVDAYGKVQAKGKASLEELNRFTEAGVPIMKQLADNLGLTNEELFQFVSQGRIGFAEVDRALQSLTTGEGKFAGMLEKQSTTLAGLTSTLKDNVMGMAADIAEIFVPAMKAGVDWLTNLVRGLRGAGTALVIFGTTWEEHFTNKIKKDIQDTPALYAFLMGLGLERFAGDLTAAEKGLVTFADLGVDTSGKTGKLASAFEAAGVAIEQYKNQFGLIPDHELLARQLDEAVGVLGKWRNAIVTLGGTAPELQAFINKLVAWRDVTRQIGDATKAAFNPLGMLPQTFDVDMKPNWTGLIGGGGMSPEDFQVPALTGAFDELKNAVGPANAELIRFIQLLGAVGGEIVPVVLNAQQLKENLFDSLKEGMLSTTLSGLVSGLGDLGAVLGSGVNAANQMELAFINTFVTIASGLADVFLAGALSAFKDGSTALGLALLLAAGVTVFGGSAIGANERARLEANSGSSSTSAFRPGKGSTYAGDTVSIVNYNGDVFTGDEREATTLATVRASGGSR